MSDVLVKRRAEQARLEAYREQALRKYGSKTVMLALYSPVDVCEGGAFVTMTVWIPDADLPDNV